MPPGLRDRVTGLVAWVLAAGCWAYPYGLLFAPFLLALWWAHRWTGRVSVAALYLGAAGLMVGGLTALGLLPNLTS